METASANSTLAFHTVPLFGGALPCSLPTTFLDVSELRQVPDTQEVFLERDGFTSIVFDVLERVEESHSSAPSGRNVNASQADQSALQTHLEDVVEGTEGVAGVKVWERESAEATTFAEGTPVFNIIATMPPGEKQQSDHNKADFVAVLLTLIRLEKQITDLVVTINVPHVEGEYDSDGVDLDQGKRGELIERGAEVRKRVLETLVVTDWDLFVQD